MCDMAIQSTSCICVHVVLSDMAHILHHDIMVSSSVRWLVCTNASHMLADQLHGPSAVSISSICVQTVQFTLCAAHICSICSAVSSRA